MYRTNTCGELRLSNAGNTVTLAGWVQRTRKMGGMTFVDLRDRYGITQLVFNEATDAELCERANKLGREYCIQVTGNVSERESKNKNSYRRNRNHRFATQHPQHKCHSSFHNRGQYRRR